jgi:hypothetical protein
MNQARAIAKYNLIFETQEIETNEQAFILSGFKNRLTSDCFLYAEVYGNIFYSKFWINKNWITLFFFKCY